MMKEVNSWLDALEALLERTLKRMIFMDKKDIRFTLWNTNDLTGTFSNNL